jgi:hypothetical protein
MTADTGAEFAVTIDDDGLIASVAGPWPEESGAEFVLEGPLPAHRNISEMPDSVRALAAESGWEVCYYDDVGCRTCVCDGSGRMRCGKYC